MKAVPKTKKHLPRAVGRRVIERRVLREDIRDQLIESILGGHLAPGDRIVETRIAQQFGVSQAPVREALRDLELFGFIVTSPFRGAIVRQISVEELVQMIQTQRAYELNSKAVQTSDQMLQKLAQI